MNDPAAIPCYIDRRPCAGARFSFCNDCQQAQKENAGAIANARTPVEITLAHIPDKNRIGGTQNE